MCPSKMVLSERTVLEYIFSKMFFKEPSHNNENCNKIVDKINNKIYTPKICQMLEIGTTKFFTSFFS